MKQLENFSLNTTYQTGFRGYMRMYGYQARARGGRGFRNMGFAETQRASEPYLLKYKERVSRKHQCACWLIHKG